MKHFRKFPNLFFALALLAGLIGLAQPVQASAPLLADLWVTNGSVNTTLLSGSTLYIGGNFTYVGPPTGSFAALDAGGAPDLAFPPVNGTVYVITADGAGGWYLGGRFTNVGGHPRTNLAHLKADKSLDFAWNPGANDRVIALVVDGSTIYAAGDFTSIGGQSRNYIAALDAVNGNATAWNPNANNSVKDLAVAPPISGVSGSTVYAVGDFTNIGGLARNYIAALSTTTGAASSWDPNADRSLNTLAVAPPISGVSGSTLYVGGNFTSIGGQSRNRIAALSTTTGQATTWNPGVTGSFVRALMLSGSTLYVGGYFTVIGGQNRNNIAALDINSNTATGWNPNADGQVDTLAAESPLSGMSGSTIYAVGEYSSIGGQSRHGIAGLDTGTGLATTWNPIPNNEVYALATSGSTVCAGGGFTSIGGQRRNRIAALDTATGRATSWDPNANDAVYALMAAPPLSGLIYAGGDFTSIGGQSRNFIAALDVSSGNATSWNPDADGRVHALGLNGSTIYVGGGFDHIGGQTRNFIAALDAGSGNATTWNAHAGGVVFALAVSPASSSTIYVGGTFVNIGGQNRNFIAELDASSGNATSWNPDANDMVWSLAVAPPISGVAPGSQIYAAGRFGAIGGQIRSFIAALDASTGSATAWNPNANNFVRVIAIAPNSTIYAGGNFTTIGGQDRASIAALDAGTGSATAWNPNALGLVNALVVAPPISGVAPPISGGSSSTIYVGGSFTSIGGRSNSYLGALRDGARTCQSAASGGSWRVSNWSNCGGAIPGDGDSVVMQAGHALTLYGSLAANNLTINAGGELRLPQDSSLSVDGTLTNNGRLTQTLAAPGSTATTFLNIKNDAANANKYWGVTLTPGGDMGATRVTVRGNQSCASAAGDVLIQRCFEISPATPRTATVRFYYSNAELNGLAFNQLKAWLPRGFGWLQFGTPYSYSTTCNGGQQDCWVQAQNVSAYSTFVLGSRVHSVVLIPLVKK